MSDTGFPGTDAQFDFSRARRRRALSRLANRLRGEPSDVNHILPFEVLPEQARGGIVLRDKDDYSELAEGVEAWGFRVMQAREELLSRAQIAEAWLRDEYGPVVDMLREADLIGKRSETQAYMRVCEARWRLLRTHEWDEEIIQRLRGELRRR